MERKKLLGRLAVPDVRDHSFALIRPRKAAGITTRNWYARGVWDQGMTSRCVEYSALKLVEAGPVINKKIPFLPGGGGELDFYKMCQNVDEWPGDNYDGTSVRAAMKILQEHQLVESYYWAWDIATAANFILTTGPMVFGTIWTESMFEPDAKGFMDVKRSPEIVGGHAYLAIGVNTKIKCPDGTKGAFRILNSWGQSWGDDGRAYLPFSHADILFKEDGEAACALEVKPPAKIPVSVGEITKAMHRRPKKLRDPS